MAHELFATALYKTDSDPNVGDFIGVESNGENDYFVYFYNGGEYIRTDLLGLMREINAKYCIRAMVEISIPLIKRLASHVCDNWHQIEKFTICGIDFPSTVNLIGVKEPITVSLEDIVAQIQRPIPSMNFTVEETLQLTEMLRATVKDFDNIYINNLPACYRPPFKNP